MRDSPPVCAKKHWSSVSSHEGRLGPCEERNPHIRTNRPKFEKYKNMLHRPRNAWKIHCEVGLSTTHQRSVVFRPTMSLGALKTMHMHRNFYSHPKVLFFTKEKKHKWFENDPFNPYISFDLIFQSPWICAKITPWLIWLLWIHFLDQIRNLTHLSSSKSQFKFLGPMRSNACAVQNFLILCGSWNPFNSKFRQDFLKI